MIGFPVLVIVISLICRRHGALLDALMAVLRLFIVEGAFCIVAIGLEASCKCCLEVEKRSVETQKSGCPRGSIGLAG
jgi:hypothetical protein